VVTVAYEVFDLDVPAARILTVDADEAVRVEGLCGLPVADPQPPVQQSRKPSQSWASILASVLSRGVWPRALAGIWLRATASGRPAISARIQEAGREMALYCWIMSAEVAEEITVGVPPADVYGAVCDVRRMARWSPECFAVWVWSRRDGAPARFVGFNRRGPFVWFTTCHVVAAQPGQEFAFEVTTFGMPVARWSYRMATVPGGTQVTEHWLDQRGRGAHILGRVFTGRVANTRPEANREGMHTTLARLKRELEAAGTTGS
jgi:hypothetical protein